MFFLHMVQEYSSMFNTGQSLYEKIQLYFTKWFLCLLENGDGLHGCCLTLQEVPSKFTGFVSEVRVS